MIFSGRWHKCEDGVTRPIIPADLIGFDGTIANGLFFVDSGADRTVLSAELLGRSKLAGAEPPSGDRLEGIGGGSPFVLVKTALRLVQVNGATADFRGEYAAFTDATATDFSILGRDILNLFDVILSRRRNEVLLLTSLHQYLVAGP